VVPNRRWRGGEAKGRGGIKKKRIGGKAKRNVRVKRKRGSGEMQSGEGYSLSRTKRENSGKRMETERQSRKGGNRRRNW